MKPIVSIKEARKILGVKSNDMNDEDVAELVSQLHDVVKVALKNSRRKVKSAD